MAHLFANYDRDYQDLVNDINAKIHRIRNKSGGERAKEVAACDQDIQAANEVLETMELGVSSIADATQRKTMEEKVRKYKNQINDLTVEMQAAEADNSDREKLFAGARSDLMMTSTDHREQMMKTTKALQSDTDDLRNAAALAEVTVGIALDTAQDINHQGEKLRSMRDRFSGINDSITAVRRNLAEMSRRNITTKIMLAGIVFMLAGTILVLIYIYFS